VKLTAEYHLMPWYLINTGATLSFRNPKVYYRVHKNPPLISVLSKAGVGRAIAQVVSRWLPTAAARVRSQVRSCGIRGGQIGTGAGFLRVLRFPLPILIPPTTP
jgi:hypothetical protein